MKTKLLMGMMALTVLIISKTTIAQLPADSYAKNIIMADISGTTQNLYSYLNAGKPVVLDISAVWCPPCWAYHSSGALESFYNSYGPPGNNSAMVLWIEGDQSPLACLQGNGCSTQGNWTTGTTFPMILTAPPNNTQVLTDYKINYFPTVYKICPDRTVYEVGTLNASALHSSVQTCPALSTTSNDVKAFSAATPLALCGSFTPSIVIQNYGSSQLTSCTVTAKIDGVCLSTYNWTGSLARYDIATVTMPGITGVTSGSHTIMYELANPNGTTDDNTANNTITKTFIGPLNYTSLPIIEGFVNVAFPPSGWMIWNPDNDAYTWERATVGGFGNSTNSAKLDFYDSPIGNIDEMILPPVDLSTVSAAAMTFNVAYARMDASYFDALQVQVSVNCGTTWVTKYNKQGTSLATAPDNTNAFAPTATQWRTETVNLSAFAGQSKVFIKFKGISGNGNNLYVDDVNIANTSAVNDISEDNANITVYPNPFSESTNVVFALTKPSNVSARVYNLLGEEVYSIDKVMYGTGTHELIINAERLKEGVYLLNLIVGDSKYTKKLTVVK